MSHNDNAPSAIGMESVMKKIRVMISHRLTTV